MTDRVSKVVLLSVMILGSLLLAFLAYSRPGFFTDVRYLAGLLLLELTVAAVWMYRLVFFPLVLAIFLLAGTSLLPGAADWAMARWVVLGFGGWVGCVIVISDGRLRFGRFHAIAAFAVLAALASAAASRYPVFSVFKALSVLLLFLYSATGARLAAVGRETRFFAGLLTGCEAFVGAIAVCYLLGHEVMGNPNSLGAVMGVVAAPILFWGIMVSQKRSFRQLFIFSICMGLIFYSHSRAGLSVALISCGLLCLVLRKYKLFAQGVCLLVIIVATSAIVRPEFFSNRVSDISTSVLYKTGDPSHGVLSSRASPWQQAVDTIGDNFWFGTGFGTTDNGLDASENLGQFSTNTGVTRENGSSYLAIVTWVGMLGVLPFLCLVVAIVGKILRTIAWTVNTKNPSHPAVPLAMVVGAGLLHAGFEDWLFAPGYYLCVFFWSMAFVLVDFAPQSPLPTLPALWRPRTIRPMGSGRPAIR